MVGSQQQESALPDRMRVGEAIALFRGPRARSVDGLLEAFGLAAHRRTSYAALSGGQRQRLSLVLAVLNRPRLIILDELTQGLDPAARRDVWEAIGVLRDAGTTMLLVTHYMDEAQDLCGRVVVIRAGQVCQVLDTGTPDQLVLRHAPWATVRFGSAGVATDRMCAVPGVTSSRRGRRLGGGARRPRDDRARLRRTRARRRARRPQRGDAGPESAMVTLLTNDSPPEHHRTPAFSGGIR